jgi:signal peptidase I
VNIPTALLWSAAAAVLAVLGFLAWRHSRGHLVVTVHGPSMLPTYPAGDRLLIRRVGLPAVQRGDVVVLTKLNGPAGGRPELIIKRAVAIPGEPVPAGIPVAERVVPPGRLVVLGDNPNASYDSRRAGYFGASTVVGVVVRPMS